MTDLRAERPSSSDYTEFMRPGTRVPRINCTTEKAGFMCEAKELIYNISLFFTIFQENGRQRGTESRRSRTFLQFYGLLKRSPCVRSPRICRSGPIGATCPLRIRK